MASPLSSFLVRDGLVGVKRMEQAFRNQVVYGGGLETILLEMNLVGEERLTQYLALATGIPPAPRDDGAAIERDAIALIDAETASRTRAIPMSLAGEALRVLVCEPLELGALEDLADQLDRPLQPAITPEFRWHLAYASAYGVEPPARFVTLARQLAARQLDAAAGVMPGTTSDAAAPSRAASEVITARLSPRTVTSGEITDKLVYEPPIEVGRHGTLVGVPAPVPQLPTVTHGPTRAGSSPRPDVPLTPSTGVPQAVSEPVRPDPPASPDPPALAESAPDDGDGPLAIARARELLALADDRDRVFQLVLRAARTRVRYAGLLTVQGGAAVGRLALADAGLDVGAIATALIPLDVASPYRAVTFSRQPHIGSLAAGDPGVDAMTLRLGGVVPPSALLLPIVLRDRVVAIVVAHRGLGDLKLADVTELLPLAAGAADALGRLIVKHKAAGYRAPAPDSAPTVDVTQVEARSRAPTDAGWRAPAPSDALPPELPASPAPSPAATSPRPPIEHVLDELERAPEGGAEAQLTASVERVHEALGELARRFPGTLRTDRFAVTGRPLRAAQYGGLLELVVRLGPAAAELVIDRMSSPQRDVRFYAVVCAAEIRLRNAIFALVERVFDPDFGVRGVAIDALRGYPHAELTHALARARRAVHSSEPDTVLAATTALVQLSDVEALDDLISAVERGDRGAEHARKALTTLTAQDFGASERKWRRWHEEAQHRHRIEWLIEGLGHKEDALREIAINELRRLTGEYFGYHHDLPKKEREVAARRWAAWWRETGQRRFAARGAADDHHGAAGTSSSSHD